MKMVFNMLVVEVDFTSSRESACLLCDGEEPQEPTSSYCLINSSLRVPQSPRLHTFISSCSMSISTVGNVSLGWTRHKIQMNQCLLSQVLCLQAKQNNYYPTWVPCCFSRTSRRSESIRTLPFEMHFKWQWLFCTGIVHLCSVSFSALSSRVTFVQRKEGLVALKLKLKWGKTTLLGERKSSCVRVLGVYLVKCKFFNPAWQW